MYCCESQSETVLAGVSAKPNRSWCYVKTRVNSRNEPDRNGCGQCKTKYVSVCAPTQPSKLKSNETPGKKNRIVK